MNKAEVYIGAYLEVVDNIGEPIEDMSILNALSLSDQCSGERDDKKLFWKPNTRRRGSPFFIVNGDSSDAKDIEINQTVIDNCRDSFILEYCTTIIKLKRYYGGGEVKFGYLMGYN